MNRFSETRHSMVFASRSLTFAALAISLTWASPLWAQSRTGAGPAVTLPSTPMALLDLRTTILRSVKVEYVETPWGPKTMAQIEGDGENWLSKRQWPFARLELGASATVAGTRLAPGNYALVLRRMAPPAGPGLEVEFLRTTDADFLMPGIAMARVPAGEPALVMPVTLERLATVAPKLTIALEDRRETIRLAATYGDRRFVTDLKLR